MCVHRDGARGQPVIETLRNNLGQVTELLEEAERKLAP